MTDARDNYRTCRDAGAAFFGAITASVSHELNNLFAIVDQSGGLLQDLLQGDSPLEPERVSAAADTMCRQAARGLEIVRRLNRLAHSADDDLVEFDAQEVLANLTSLCRRLAELKNVRLTLAPASDTLRVKGSPFDLQAAVFWALRAGLAESRRDDEIVVSAERDDGVCVRIACPSGIDPGNPDMVTLERLARHIGAGLAHKAEESGTLVQISYSGGPGAAD